MQFRYTQSARRNARTLRNNMTPWERKLWYQFLRSYRPRFSRQRPIGNFVVDFYCSKARLAIELDGSQHCLQHKAAYDESRTVVLASCGIEVVRFANTSLLKNFAGVCLAIDMKVKERMGGDSGGNGGLRM